MKRLTLQKVQPVAELYQQETRVKQAAYCEQLAKICEENGLLEDVAEYRKRAG